MATHYTVWHYQEQFGSIVFVTALQTAMGTYTSYPHLRGQSQKQFLRTAQSMLYLWQAAQSDTASNTHGLQIFPVSTGDSVLNSFPKGMEKRQKRYEDG